MQFIAVEVFIYLLFDYEALFVCIKDRTCSRIAVPAYCFNTFASLIKKLILGCKTV